MCAPTQMFVCGVVRLKGHATHTLPVHRQRKEWKTLRETDSSQTERQIHYTLTESRENSKEKSTTSVHLGQQKFLFTHGNVSEPAEHTHPLPRTSAVKFLFRSCIGGAIQQRLKSSTRVGDGPASSRTVIVRVAYRFTSCKQLDPSTTK